MKADPWLLNEDIIELVENPAALLTDEVPLYRKKDSYIEHLYLSALLLSKKSAQSVLFDYNWNNDSLKARYNFITRTNLDFLSCAVRRRLNLEHGTRQYWDNEKNLVAHRVVGMTSWEKEFSAYMKPLVFSRLIQMFGACQVVYHIRSDRYSERTLAEYRLGQGITEQRKGQYYNYQFRVFSIHGMILWAGLIE
ncbi:MAG: hypothetical protein U1F77_15080 [Kiritimatiellia bacterium]